MPPVYCLYNHPKAVDPEETLSYMPLHLGESEALDLYSVCNWQCGVILCVRFSSARFLLTQEKAPKSLMSLSA